MSGVFVVLIHPDARAILAPAFSVYLHEKDSVHYFLSTTDQQIGQFLSLTAAKNLDSENFPGILGIQIPVGYVLGIVAMQEDKNPVGFLP